MERVRQGARRVLPLSDNTGWDEVADLSGSSAGRPALFHLQITGPLCGDAEKRCGVVRSF